MKILLISPSQRQIYGSGIPPPYPPIGLLMIGAVLKEIGKEVKFIDYDAENFDKEKLVNYLNDFRPDLVGLTCVTPTFKTAFWIAKTVKETLSALVVLGGIHPTIVPEDCLKDNNIDFLIVGEGELTIQELVDYLDNHRVDFQNIKGLWYKKGQEVIKGRPRELIEDLDNLPFPAWELVTDLKKYRPPDALHSPIIPMMTSRGCPFNCIFCCSKQIFGQRFRARSKDSIIAEIRYYIDNFGLKELHIMDDVFTLDKERTLEICRAIQENKFNLTLSFANGIRTDSIDEEILQALKKAGFRDLAFGIESGDEEILKRNKKGITKEQSRNAFKLVKKYGFNSWGFFIIGLSGETKETVKKTIDFAIELDPDFAKFAILVPFPGTEVFDDFNRRNYIKDFNYDNYGIYSRPVYNLPGLSAQEMASMQRRAYLKFYLRPKKIVKLLLKIKNLTQLKLNFPAAKFLLRRFFSH